MKCRGCNEDCIGETVNYLRRQVTVHNQQIRDPKTRMLVVSEHLIKCAHQMNPKFYIFPFYIMYLDSTSLRRTKENYLSNFNNLNKIGLPNLRHQGTLSPNTYSNIASVIITTHI